MPADTRTDAAFDLLIRNATVIDGTGAPRFLADVAVRDGRIASLRRTGRDAGAPTGAARREIDARERILAPGFIDCHTHDDRLLLSGPDMASKVSQGVTTVVTGNCGISLAPVPGRLPRPTPAPLDLLDLEGGWFRFARFADYLDALRDQPASTNVAPMIGHTTLRLATMSRVDRPADGGETAQMRALVQEAMDAGAVGASTGLYYAPAAAATADEIIEVLSPLRDGGVYCAHLRDEGADVIAAIEEAALIARTLGAPLVISHHKVMGVANHGRSPQTLAAIGRLSREQPVCLDCYPYDASSTVLDPGRLATSSKVLVTWSRPHPDLSGADLADIAARWGVTAQEAAQRLLPAGAIYFSMREDDVRRILSFPDTMIGSDGIPHDDMPHPRLWGTFPRVLGHYSRGVGLFPLETAVRKMTGLPARNFALADRGEIREGACADLVLFDAGLITDEARFEAPTRPAAGIDAVFVNGEAVWEAGRATGARPGRVLARS